jgi:Protein of unknown function (DUF3300)/Chaperone of endosialidase
MRISAIVFALSLAATGCPIGTVCAQDQTESTPPQQQLLDAAQLDQLVAPIALYPDPLLAQVLMASTYPLEVVQADRFAKTNKKLKGDKLKQALDQQNWDASVKELVSTPTVLATMNDQLEWTQKLGDAVLAQQADVMDAIQRLRAKAQANGKLETTKQQTVTVTQQAGQQQVISIEPASPEVVHVPYYDPGVVYGEWSYPEYPPYYYPPPAGYIVGGAIATGLAWGAAYAIGREIWDDIDWNRGDINIDVDRNIDIDRNVNVDRKSWQHDSSHRRGVKYNNDAVRNKFAKANTLPADRKLDRGRGAGGDRPDLGGAGQRPDVGQIQQGLKERAGQRPDAGQIQQGLKERAGQRPDAGQIQQGLKERSGKQAALERQKPDLGQAKRQGGNGFDPSDGRKAKDFSKRGQASLGNRGPADFKRPSGGGAKAVQRGGRPSMGRPGGGGRQISRGGGGGRGGMSRGGGGRGGGGRGGGGRRSDIRLKEDIAPLMHLGNGLKLYAFRYRGSDHTVYVGVMAQEVQKIDPSAVSHDRQGYLMVDYDRIGLKFMTWKEWQAKVGTRGER